MSDHDPLDDAIDRAVREMTRAAADDDAAAVARVIARLRDADDARRPAREHRSFAPRLAWAGAAALALIAIVVTSYLQRSSDPDTHVPRVVENAPPQQPSQPANTVREIPTPAAVTPSTVRATTARHTRGRMLRPSSVANGMADGSEWPERTEMTPIESDITLASIMPAPLGDAPAIEVEPLTTSSLQVDEIPVQSIELPPVSPERQE
jgi:hypothetical protein